MFLLVGWSEVRFRYLHWEELKLYSYLKNICKHESNLSVIFGCVNNYSCI